MDQEIKTVVCIDKNSNDITFGKKYQIFLETGSYYKTHYFIGDDGLKYLYFDKDTSFISLEEFRKLQIEKIYE
jgi:hypothetical protein